MSVLPWRLASIRAVQPSYRGVRWSGRDGLNHCGLLRYTDPVFGLDISPSVQQERHDVRLTIATGVHQDRLTILQRTEVVRKAYTQTRC
jgi:hypothetical protein